MRPRSFVLTGVVIACIGLAGPRSFGQEPAPPQKIEIPPNASTLVGVPTVRIDSTAGATTRRVLGATEAAKERLTDSVVDGQLYWTSRGNRLLRLNSSGDFTYLASEPGTYIRFTRLNDKISYVEHVDQGLGSITWCFSTRSSTQASGAFLRSTCAGARVPSRGVTAHR